MAIYNLLLRQQFIIYLYLWGNINLFLSLKTRWREQNAKQLRVVNIITIEKKNFKKNWINLISYNSTKAGIKILSY